MKKNVFQKFLLAIKGWQKNSSYINFFLVGKKTFITFELMNVLI